MTTLTYSDYTDFNEVIDSEVIVVIRQSYFNASNVLYTLDYDKYEIELTKFLDNEEVLTDLIQKQFPSIISFAFSDYYTSDEDLKHKIKLIKKIWDSIIGILYGLFVAEIFEEKIPLGKSRINAERICIGDTGLQLIIIEDLFEYLLQENYHLAFFKIIDFEGFLEVKQIYSQSKDYFLIEDHDTEESLEETESRLKIFLMKAIKKVRNLWHVNFVKYINHEVDIFPNCQFFKGTVFPPNVNGLNINKAFITENPDFILSKFIYANYFGKTILVSPLIHFIEDTDGNPSICLFKNSSEDGISYLTTSGKLKKINNEECLILIRHAIESIKANKEEYSGAVVEELKIDQIENFNYYIFEGFIKEGKINHALEYLKSTMQGFDEKRDVLTLLIRYQKLRNDIINGILSFDEENRERNRITHAMLTLTEPFQKK